MNSGLYACAGASATASAAAWAKRFEEPITNRSKTLGTPRTKSSSESSSPSTPANHVRYVVSLSAPLSRPDTSPHRLAAVSSTWGSNGLSLLLGRGRANGDHTSLHAPPQHAHLWIKKHCFAGLSRRPQNSPHLWTASRFRRLCRR